MRNLLRRLTGEERGVAIVIATLVMTSLLGMTALTVDVARFFTLQRQLQNAADAAAHASAQMLPDTTAAQLTAEEYFANNAPTLGAGSILVSFPPGSDARVQIQATASISSTFGRLLGVPGITVTREAEARSTPRDVVLALDRSGSMCFDSHPSGSCGSTGPWEPFTSVQNAAVTFANKFYPQYDQLGLVSYATTATLNSALTHTFGPGTPYNSAIMALTPAGTTNIGHALFRARCELLSANSRADAARVIVLLTDGIPNVYNNSPLNACGSTSTWTSCGSSSGCAQATNFTTTQAQLARDAGIVIHVIGMGEDVNGALLQSVADIGGGIYLYSPDSAGLNSAFQTIADLTSVYLIR
jgi:Flp pilus assembly protein TadG